MRGKWWFQCVKQLSQKLHFANNSAIKYLYNSAGIKLTEKLYLADTLNKTTDYIGDKIYEDGVLKMFGHPEGRVLVSESGDFEYQYAYSDHLGITTHSVCRQVTVIPEWTQRKTSFYLMQALS
jgi:hypothetical protein